MVYLKYLPIYSVLALLLASCGLERNQQERSPASSVGEALTTAPRDLSTEEEAVATRICYAYRNKRLNFSNIHLGDSYTFSEKTNDCSNLDASLSDTAVVSIDATGPHFSGSSANMSFPIETDSYGYMADVCEKLTKGEKAQNIISKNGETLLYSFDSTSGQDTYAVKIALSAPLNTSNTIRFVHEYTVITSGSDSKTLGLVTSYSRTSICSTIGQTDTLIRSYTP